MIGRWEDLRHENTRHRLDDLAVELSWSFAETKNQVMQLGQMRAWSDSRRADDWVRMEQSFVSSRELIEMEPSL